MLNIFVAADMLVHNVHMVQAVPNNRTDKLYQTYYKYLPAISNSKLDGTFLHVLVFTIILFSSFKHIGSFKEQCRTTFLYRELHNTNHTYAENYIIMSCQVWNDCIYSINSIDTDKAITIA